MLPTTRFMLASTFIIMSAIYASASMPAQNPSTLSKVDRRQQEAIALRKAAINALEPLFDELRKMDNLQEKVLLAHSLVDLLRKSRPQDCRKMLILLLDECVRLKGEEQNKSDVDPDLLARKIIQISATFDRKLAKLLLEQYDRENDPDQKQPGLELSRTRFYLTVATDLIQGNLPLATSIAEKVISGPVMPETLRFLVLLRKKDINSATRLFFAATAGVRSRGGMDVNESLLLFSYVFSPRQVPIVTSQGLGAYQIADYSSLAADIPQGVAEEHLDATVQLLLDPARYSRQAIQPPFGPDGDWFLIKFLEPKISVYRANLTDAITAQRYVLEARMENRQGEVNAAIDRWNNSSGQNNSGGKEDPVESFLKRAEQAPSTKRKDQFLYRAAMAAVQIKAYDRALKIADELSTEYRKAAKDYLRFEIAMAAIHEGDNDRATHLAELDEDLLRRAYVLTQIAKSAVDRKPADLEQIRLLLSTVDGLVPRLATDAERVSALAGVIEVYSRFDRAEGFKCLQELIRHANRINAFAGNISVSRLLEIGGFYFDYSLYTDTSLDGVLRSMALLDFNTTLEDVRQLESRTARLKGTVAVCESVLS